MERYYALTAKTNKSASVGTVRSVESPSEVQSYGGSTVITHTQEDTEEASGHPTQICTYYAKGTQGIGQGCLRVNCKFFHGTEEQLAELRERSVDGYSESEEGGRKKQQPLRVDMGGKCMIVCLAFLNNACRRPGCRFLHLPPNVRPLPVAVCEAFGRRRCTRKRCKYFHGTKEALASLTAKGVTMYNPTTNEAHDPSTSLEELIKLQERTTVPLTAPVATAMRLSEQGYQLPQPLAVPNPPMVAPVYAHPQVVSQQPDERRGSYYQPDSGGYYTAPDGQGFLRHPLHHYHPSVYGQYAYTQQPQQQHQQQQQPYGQQPLYYRAPHEYGQDIYTDMGRWH